MRNAAQEELQKMRSREGRRSVSRVLSANGAAVIVIHLGRPSPDASSNLPGSNCGPQPMLPYLVLLQPGFTLPPPLPAARCALTAPFHPYPYRAPLIIRIRQLCADRTIRGALQGGIFSVALSVGLRLPGVTWRPALWSPDFPPSQTRQRLSDRLPATNIMTRRENCKHYRIKFHTKYL